MTALDLKFRRAADKLLAKFGRSTDFTIRRGGIYDTTTGAITGGTVTQFTVIASPPVPMRQRFVQGTTTPTGDTQIVIKAENEPFTVREGDTVETGDRAWTVDSIEILEGPTLRVAYVLNLTEVGR